MAELDVFPVYNPVTEEIMGHKSRDLVHTDGDWHRGIQANIVRSNQQQTFDILLQERSGIVDIGRCKLDQSLATQMLDGDHGNENEAIRRGLLTELGITACRATRLPLNLRIVKTYKEQPEVLNRELVSLYLVSVDDESQIMAVSPKIAGLRWMEWHRFLGLIHNKPDTFTKTGQFYFSDEVLLPFIEEATYAFLGHKELPPAPSSAILHIDRYEAGERTLRGNVDDIIMQSGEAA